MSWERAQGDAPSLELHHNLMNGRPFAEPPSAAFEVLPSLGRSVVELLRRFYEVNRMHPRRVLFYRDGVGDSQFGDVMLHEVSTLCAFMHAFTPCTLSISCTSTCACQGATSFESHYLYVLLH